MELEDRNVLLDGIAHALEDVEVIRKHEDIAFVRWLTILVERRLAVDAARLAPEERERVLRDDVGLGCLAFLFRLLDNYVVFLSRGLHLIAQRDGRLKLASKRTAVTAAGVAALECLAGMRPEDVLDLVQRPVRVVVGVPFRQGMDSFVLIRAELGDRQGAEPPAFRQGVAVLVAVQQLLAAVPVFAALQYLREAGRDVLLQRLCQFGQFTLGSFDGG